uniref:Uncharacterized protein n=1 Tax=Heliothis virescens TaxID=7102 RepID=A0A2A4J0Q9_HELVI
MSTRLKYLKNVTSSFQNFSDILGHESKIHNGFSCLVVPRSIPLRRPDCKYYKQDYVRRNNVDYAKLVLTPAPGNRTLNRIASDLPLPGKWLNTVHTIPARTPVKTLRSTCSALFEKDEYPLLTPKLNKDAKGFDEKAISFPETLQQQMKIGIACEELLKPKTSLFRRKKCTFVVPLNFYRHFSSVCKKGSGGKQPSKENETKTASVCARLKKTRDCSKGGKKGGGKGPICPPPKQVKDCPPKGKKRGGKGPICPPQKKVKDCPPTGGKKRKGGSICGAPKKVKDCPPKGGPKAGKKSTGSICGAPKRKASTCAPRKSKSSSCAPKKSKSSSCAPRKSKSSSCAPKKSKSSSCAPKKSKSSSCAPKKSKSSSCAPKKSKSSSCAPKKSKSSSCAPKKSKSSSCSPKKSKSSSCAPKKSKSSSCAPKKSKSSSCAPKKSNFSWLERVISSCARKKSNLKLRSEKVISPAALERVHMISACTPGKGCPWESTNSFYYGTQNLHMLLAPKLDEDVKGFYKKNISFSNTHQQQMKIRTACVELFKLKTRPYYRRYSSKCPCKKCSGGGRPDDPDNICTAIPRKTGKERQSTSVWCPRKKVKACSSKGRKKKGKGPAYNFQKRVTPPKVVKMRPVCPPRKKKKKKEVKNCCPKGKRIKKVYIIPACTPGKGCSWESANIFYYGTQNLHMLLASKLEKGLDKKTINCPNNPQQQMKIGTACEEFEPKTSLCYRKRCNFVVPLNFYRHYSSAHRGRPDDPDKVCKYPTAGVIRKKRQSKSIGKTEKHCSPKGRKKKLRGPAFHFHFKVEDSLPKVKKKLGPRPVCPPRKKKKLKNCCPKGVRAAILCGRKQQIKTCVAKEVRKSSQGPTCPRMKGSRVLKTCARRCAKKSAGRRRRRYPCANLGKASKKSGTEKKVCRAFIKGLEPKKKIDYCAPRTRSGKPKCKK